METVIKLSHAELISTSQGTRNGHLNEWRLAASRERKSSPCEREKFPALSVKLKRTIIIHAHASTLQFFRTERCNCGIMGFNFHRNTVGRNSCPVSDSRWAGEIIQLQFLCYYRTKPTGTYFTQRKTLSRWEFPVWFKLYTVQ